MKTTSKLLGILAFFVFLIPLASIGQSAHSYNFGTDYNVSFGGTNINFGDAYLDGLQKMHTPLVKRFVEAGSLKSDKILSCDAGGTEDFDLMLKMEYEKCAEMSPNHEGGKRFKNFQKPVQQEIGEGASKETVANNDSSQAIPER